MEKENKIVKGVSIELSKRCLLFSLHEYSARSDHIVRRSEHSGRALEHLSLSAVQSTLSAVQDTCRNPFEE